MSRLLLLYSKKQKQFHELIIYRKIKALTVLNSKN